MNALFTEINKFKPNLTRLRTKARYLHLRPIPFFLLCSCLIVIGVLANSKWAENREKADMHRTLASIGQLRVGQVRSYLTEREGDAEIMSDLLRAMSAQRWLNDSKTNPPHVLHQAIGSIIKAHHYRSILVLDSQANVRLTNGQGGGLTATGKSIAWQAIRDHASAVSLYAGDPSAAGEAVLDTFVPIMNQNGIGVLGVVVMRGYSEPLFKLLQSWPVTSATAETLLLTRDGDDVLFLNELRHSKNAALRLRIPLSNTAVSDIRPAVSAVMERYGPVEASDYRGKPVLAYTMPVPDTSWSMVVKIDRDEALQYSHRLQWVVSSFAMLLISLLGVLIWQWWLRTKSDRLANDRLRETEANLNRAQKVAGVGSWQLDMRKNALSWSEENCRIFGVEPGITMTYETFLNCVHPDDREFVDQQWKAALQGQFYDIEHRLIVDGRVIWVRERAELQYDLNGQAIFGVGTTQDITERRLLENELRQSREQFMTVFDQAPIGMVIRDLDGKCIQSNQALQKIFGYSATELLDIPLREMVHPDDEDKVLEAYMHMHQCGEDSYYHKDRRYLRKNGEVLWGRVITSLVRDIQGKPYFTIAMFEDVTESKQVEEEMKLAKLVYQFSNEAILVTDADNSIIAINPAFTEITGYTKKEVIGKKSSLLKSGRHDQVVYAAMWRQLNTTGKWQGEIWNCRKNGEHFVERLSINTIYNDDATVHRRVALFSDITEKKKNEERIWNQANFDALTDLPNRHLFRDRLELEIKKSQRTQLSLALLFMDLDRFKEVNDTLGHDVGDLLLKEAAVRVKSCLRKSDTVGRFGGDEFTVILGDLNGIDCIDRIVSDLLLKLAMPFQLENEVVYISACIGVALYPNDATDVTTLLKCADQAMYAAKNTGENHFSYYTPEMQNVANVRMRLIKDMHTALAEHQFRVHYQPIVDLATGYIHKAEALIRWQHPELGLINPAEFIPIAEDTGLIIEIGNWVFYQAVAQTVHMRANHNPEFQISINKSPVQFMADTNHHSNWLEHLEGLGLPRQVIVIEITEGLLMEAKDQISSQLLTFRDNGIQVALDDFGTGYSSLSYLKKFDIDYIKIDRSFVSNLATDNNDMVLCEAMIKMAHELDIRVIAEGVETEDQRILLQQMGCDFGQGYFFSKPLPSEEFEKMLYEHPAKYSGDLFNLGVEGATIGNLN